AHAHRGALDPSCRALPDLRVPGPRDRCSQEADPLRPGQAVPEPRPTRRRGARSAGRRPSTDRRRRADAARVLGHRRHPATAQERRIPVKSARFLALAFVTLAAMSTAAGAAEEPRVIAISARRFEFSPSTITLKKGETVKLVVTSEDVTHGLFLRTLKIDSDL